MRTGWPVNPWIKTMLQIISPSSDQAANLAHSRVGLSGSTRTERPVALGSLSLLDDEHLSSPMAKSGANCTGVRLCDFGRSFLECGGVFRGALRLESAKLPQEILGHTSR